MELIILYFITWQVKVRVFTPEVRKESSSQVIFRSSCFSLYYKGGLSSKKLYLVIYYVQIVVLISNSPANLFWEHLKFEQVERKLMKLSVDSSFWMFFTLTENFELFQLCPKQGKDETTREAASFISGILSYLSNISA